MKGMEKCALCLRENFSSFAENALDLIVQEVANLIEARGSHLQYACVMLLPSEEEELTAKDKDKNENPK